MRATGTTRCAGLGMLVGLTLTAIGCDAPVSAPDPSGVENVSAARSALEEDSEPVAAIWPVGTDLVYQDGDIFDLWHDVGDVEFMNTRKNLTIDIATTEAYKIINISIAIVQDDEIGFSDYIDRKGNLRPNSFPFKTDYLADYGYLVDSHHEVIDFDYLEDALDFKICWGANPERCPPFFYILAHVEMQRMKEVLNPDTGELGWIPDGKPGVAYAEGNPGAFDRYYGDEEKRAFWVFYVTYPLAKIEAGHFVDANVNGLTFATQTQSGVTGDGGQYWYLPGEHISFHVGGLPLGDAMAARSLSPVELFDQADLDDSRVLNVARLLQSLDADGKPAQGAINITGPVIDCLNNVLPADIPPPEEFFLDDAAVEDLIVDILATCDVAELPAVPLTKEEAYANLNRGMKAGNLMKRNISKTPGMRSDKAKIEIMPVYVPAQRPDGSPVEVEYFDADGNLRETRNEAKPIVVSYLDEVAGTGALDVFAAISRDDGDSWKRRNLSRTAERSSLLGHPGESFKPMLKVKDNKIFVAWTDKYCRGGRPGYAITVCPDTNGDGLPDPCEVCRDTSEGTVCNIDYPGDDAYWQDDLFGVGGPQRSVFYEDYPELGEVPYSCVWTARAMIESDGNIVWFKPERLTSGRRDAHQLFAGAGTGVAFAIVWQEDPKGLLPGDAKGPGDGWSGANTNSKTDIWYSYIRLSDFAKIDTSYPAGGHGDNDDIVDTDPTLAGRVKALVPMSLPVRVSDNEMCSAENMDPTGGHGDHDFDGEGEGTHRYCGTAGGIGTADEPGANPLCAYTVEKANPKGEIHNVCVTADGRLLDGNTGASRANIFLQPYKKPDGSKSAWAIIAYEESKGVGVPPEDEGGCGDEEETATDGDGDGGDDHDRYKPDVGKNVIYHSFDFAAPEIVGGGGIVNLPETDESGNPVYLLDEDGALLLDWKGEQMLAYENARRVRLLTQPKSKKGPSGTVAVVLYRQGEEGGGKPADIFMRRVKAAPSGNPYAFANMLPGAQNVSSVEPPDEGSEYWFQDPFDDTKPLKMLRWSWSPANLADPSGKNPLTDARAHRGALDGDTLLIGYSWTPNWGRRGNDKYDFYIRRSFNGGQAFTTDPQDPEPIEHNVPFKVPVVDYENQTVSWDYEVVTTVYGPNASEPPRNVSNLRNNRISVLEPRLVKTPGTITRPVGTSTGYAEDIRDLSVYQVAYGVEFNQNTLPDGVPFPQTPLDIYYSRTQDKGQRYLTVVTTPQDGGGKPEVGWNPLARDKPEQGAAQLRQTPDGSRMYGIWLEEGEGGSDILFRRVDYR